MHIEASPDGQDVLQIFDGANECRIDVDFSQHSVPVPSAPGPAHIRRYLRKHHEPELEDYFVSRCALLRWTWDSFWFKLWSFATITCTVQTLISMGFSVGATVLFLHFNVFTDLPLTLLTIGIIFPASFGIGNNFNRREFTIREVGILKAIALSLFFGARDWPAPSSLHDTALNGLRQSLGALLTNIRQTMLHNTPPGGALQLYKSFDDLALALNRLCDADPSFRFSSMNSRLQQYFRQMIESWEKLRVVHDYRTPSALRSYAMVWLTMSSIVLAPLFAKYSHDFGFMAGIYCAIIVSAMLSGIYRVFSNEEDPFDGRGIDDLSLEPLSKLVVFMFDKPKVVL